MRTLENSYCVPTKEQWAQIQKIEPKGYVNFMGAFKKGNVIMVEWDHIDVGYMILSKKKSEVRDRKEIPVQHFIDLVEDRITPWRLEEVSFRSTNPNDSASNVFFKRMSYMASVHVSYMDGKLHDISIEPYGSEEVASIDELNISTFTELLNLIKFLTPPTK